MHTSALLPLALFSGFTTPALAQLSVLRGVLTALQADVETYGDAFAAADAPAIQSVGDELLQTVQDGLVTVQAASPIGLLDAIALRATMEALQVSVDAAYGTAVSQQPAVDGLGIGGAVHDDFVAQRDAVGDLGAAIVSKVPALVQGTAQGFVDEIDDTLAAAVAAYA